MKKMFLSAVFAFCTVIGFCQQRLDGFEFLNRDIDEILYTVSLYRGVAIVGDDTISGKATFRFAGQDFDSAFESFLSSQRLYVQKTDDVWTVSRVKFSPREDGVIFLDASDVRPAVLVEKISREFGTEITYDALGEIPVSLHTGGSSAGDFVKSVVRVLGKEYSMEDNAGRLRINRTVQERNSYSTSREKIQVRKDKENFSVDVQEASVGAVLEELFKSAGKEYIFAADTSAQIKRAMFSSRSFDETASLVCAGGGLELLCVDGIFYVVSSGGSGTSLEDSGKIWKKHGISYCSAQKAMSLVESRFGRQTCISLEDENAFLCFAKEDSQNQIADFIKSFDVEKESHVVRLKYIRTDDFMQRLPPGVQASQITRGTQDNVFFFSGNEAQFASLEEHLKEIDCPVRRLRYDLLVIQYQSTEGFDWDSSLSVRRLKLGDMTDGSVALGSVLDFNLDVVTAFGLKFASSLQTAMNENRAQVFADTTLHGVSGGTINFSNTNTYRYRDNNVNPETGVPIYSGVTREIVSGLKIDVTGWVSGDGMITSKVTASVSRQGADLSSRTGNPPPTSEKIITTEVLGKSGEPIILTGLVQNEESVVEQRTPGLSKIPVLGWMFKARESSKEKTELVIYLVPHWDREDGTETSEKEEDFYEHVYSTLVEASDE